MSEWYEIIVKGSEDALIGFVAGVESSPGEEGAAILGRDLDLEGSHLSSRLRELFAAGSRHLVFASARLAQALVARLRATGAEAGLEIEDVQEVVFARLLISAEAFSRDVASRIRETLLSGLPPGVRAEGIEEREERDPDARGPELYTPEHAYAYRVKGAFAGPLPGVIEMQRRTRDLPFVRAKSLELETRPAEKPGHAEG